MIDIEFMQLNATHPDDFVYGVRNNFWLLLLVKSPALFHVPTGDVVIQPTAPCFIRRRRLLLSGIR